MKIAANSWHQTMGHFFKLSWL